jgi:hypothetical protein
MLDGGKLEEVRAILEAQDTDQVEIQISLAHVCACSGDLERASNILLPLIQQADIFESLLPASRVQALKILAHLYRASGQDVPAEIQILSFLKRVIKDGGTHFRSLLLCVEERLCQLHCAAGETKQALALNPEYLPAQSSILSLVECYRMSQSKQILSGSVSLQVLVSSCNFGLLCCILNPQNVNGTELRASLNMLKESFDALSESAHHSSLGQGKQVRLKNGQLIVEAQMLSTSTQRLKALSAIVCALEFLDCAASGDMSRAQKILNSSASLRVDMKHTFECAFDLKMNSRQGEEKFAGSLVDWSALIAQHAAEAFLPVQLELSLGDAVAVDHIMCAY